MARPERYFIGPSMKSKLRDVIQRLGDSPLGGEGGGDIPVRLQSLVRASGSIRAATFSGSWPIGSTAVVTLTNTGSTSSPTVASTLVTATNTLYPITATAYSNEACIVGQDSGKWYLVAPKFESQTALVILSTTATTCVKDITISATLNTTNCFISIGKSLTTASLTTVSATASATFIRIRTP